MVSETFARTLSLLTLGVYLIHPIVLEALGFLGITPLNYYPLVSIPLIAIIVFGISLIGSWLISKLPYLKWVI